MIVKSYNAERKYSSFTLMCIHGNIALSIVIMYINKGDIYVYKNVSYKTRIMYS